MSLERKMRKRLSDSAAHMSVERKEKKKEVRLLHIIANYDTFDNFLKVNKCTTIKELIELKFQIPQTLDDLIIMYKKYPYLLKLPKFSDLLFEILSIDKYQLLLRINNINPMLYFSIFPDTEDTKFIDASLDDIESFYINMTLFVKDILSINIKIAKTLY